MRWNHLFLRIIEELKQINMKAQKMNHLTNPLISHLIYFKKLRDHQ